MRAPGSSDPTCFAGKPGSKGLELVDHGHTGSDRLDSATPRVQPGEPAIAISIPYCSPELMAYLKASFHSGVMYASRAASKFWKPAIPTRCIHSRSSWMPSFVMLPFIQCHQTRRRAALGESSKPFFRGSSAFWASATLAVQRRRIAATENRMHAVS